MLLADLADNGLEVREGFGFFTDLKLELLDIFCLCVDQGLYFLENRLIRVL